MYSHSETLTFPPGTSRSAAMAFLSEIFAELEQVEPGYQNYIHFRIHADGRAIQAKITVLLPGLELPLADKLLCAAEQGIILRKT